MLGTAPQYTHDCDKCVFIGHYEGHDLYRCPQQGFPAIVARWGDDRSEYRSGPVVTVGDLTLTLERQEFERESLVTYEGGLDV